MRSLPSWQIPFLGLKQFPRSLTLFEIATFFSFNDEERAAIQSRRGDHLRLAFGIHLGFLKMTGTTLSAVDRIPFFVLTQVADDLDLPHMDIATVRSLYQRRKRTLYEHQQWAMQLLGIDAFNEHHPSRFRTLREPTRTVELACFLRHALLTTNDTIVSLCDMRAADLRRQAQELANKTERIELQAIRSLLSRTRHCAEGADQSDAQVRQFVLDTFPSTHSAPVSRAHRYREMGTEFADYSIA